ncbi:hypothetical protein, partial [Nocardioides kribbensis]|uniref:hypothetical protein n=1 Tax=Nocardioides kribbensis TaxID=305517 RepID=UPI0032DBC0C5
MTGPHRHRLLELQQPLEQVDHEPDVVDEVGDRVEPLHRHLGGQGGPPGRSAGAAQQPAHEPRHGLAELDDEVLDLDPEPLGDVGH